MHSGENTLAARNRRALNKTLLGTNMDRAQITETLDKLLELHKTATGIQNEFYAIKKLIKETQEPLDFNDVEFCYKGAIFRFDDEGDLCNISIIESFDEILDKQAEASE